MSHPGTLGFFSPFRFYTICKQNGVIVLDNLILSNSAWRALESSGDVIFEPILVSVGKTGEEGSSYVLVNVPNEDEE